MKNIAEASEWLSSIIGTKNFNIEPLRKEASQRAYFRVRSEKNSFVLCDNFDEKEVPAKYLYATKILQKNSVNVPEILGFSESLRFILLEDLGDQTLDINKSQSHEKVLNEALIQLSLIKFSEQDVLKSFSENDLLAQTKKFITFCNEQNLDEEDINLINNLREDLVQNLMGQQFVPTHNDFERRNLIYHNEEIYVIDFQDLNIAPIGIDLASILFEHNFNYEDETISRLLSKHINSNGFQISIDELKRHIMQALAHRSMRIVGTFNEYFKKGIALNRQKDIKNFLQRIILSLEYLDKNNSAIIIKKIL